MKTVRVAAAVIVRDNQIFAAERGYGDMKGGWEFPGGKIEAGESAEEALVREIQEEMEIRIVPYEKLCRVEYDYPSFHIVMDCFLSYVSEGHMHLLEHMDGKWLSLEEIDSVDWLPADLLAVEALKKRGIA